MQSPSAQREITPSASRSQGGWRFLLMFIAGRRTTILWICPLRAHNSQPTDREAKAVPIRIPQPVPSDCKWDWLWQKPGQINVRFHHPLCPPDRDVSRILNVLKGYTL